MPLGPVALSKIRQQANMGVLADAMGDEAFCRALIECDRPRPHAEDRERHAAWPAGRCLSPRSWAMRCAASLPLQRLTTSSNSVSLLGDKLFLKAYRRLQPGVNLEVEIGRFLTDVAALRRLRAGAGQPRMRSARTARRPRWRCCRRRWRTRATPGFTSSNSWCGCSRATRARRARPWPRRPRKRRCSASNGWRSASPSCTSRSASAAAIRHFDPEPVTAADLRDWVGAVAAELEASMAAARAPCGRGRRAPAGRAGAGLRATRCVRASSVRRGRRRPGRRRASMATCTCSRSWSAATTS